MKELETFLQNGLENKMYTSASISIVSPQYNFSYAVGYLNPSDSEKKLTADDSLFDIASLTKVFTAVAFMRMTEIGLVGLDDRVGNLIPEYNFGDKAKITYRHLLSHSSGLPASFNLYENQEWNKGSDFVIKKLINTDLVYTPGNKVIYSCLGYMLLGHCMEKLFKNRLDIVFNELLFKNRNLTEIMFKPTMNYRDRTVVTTFSRPNRGLIDPGVVHDGNAIAIHNGISGNAGLFSSTRNLRQFINLYLDCTLLCKKSIEEMKKTQATYEENKRGLGWVLHSEDKRSTSAGRIFSNESFGHTGFTGTSIWVDPKIGTSVIFLSNSVHYYQAKEDAQKFNEFRYNLHKLIVELSQWKLT